MSHRPYREPTEEKRARRTGASAPYANGRELSPANQRRDGHENNTAHAPTYASPNHSQLPYQAPAPHRNYGPSFAHGYLPNGTFFGGGPPPFKAAQQPSSMMPFSPHAHKTSGFGPAAGQLSPNPYSHRHSHNNDNNNNVPGGSMSPFQAPGPNHLHAPIPSSRHEYSFTPFASTPFGSSSMAPQNPPTPMSSDEEVAWRLQELYDAEDYTHVQGSSSVAWSQSPFKSDLDYARTLSEGYNQPKGCPDTPPRSRNHPSVDADEEYARLFQAELDGADLSQREGNEIGVKDNRASKQRDSLPAAGPQTVSSEPLVEINLEADVAPLHQFGQHILKTECAHCKKHLLYNEKDIIKLTKKWLSKEGRADSVLQCQKCSKHTCIGCGFSKKPFKTLSNSRSEYISSPTREIEQKEVEIVTCCANGRLFLIWALLCAADHQKACNDRRDSYFAKLAPRSRANSDPPKSSRGRPVRKSNGTGYGGNDSHYAPGLMDDDYDETFTLGLLNHAGLHKRRGMPPPKIPSKSKENAEDVLLMQVFSALTKLLPTLVKAHPFDLEAPEVLPLMLMRSPVLEKAASLLRNDSLDDISQRGSLYRSLLGFLNCIANHPSTAVTVYAQRTIYPSEAGLLSASFNDHRYELRSSDKGKFKAETSRSLSEIMTQLQISARKMLQRSKAAEDDFKTGDGQSLLQLCRKICELSDLLQANAPSTQDEPSYEGKGKAPIKPKENLSKWHREHCVDEVADSLFENNFHFWRDATTSTGGTPRKGRMKNLMTELSILQTSLPDGIYVRHGSSRLDMMKVLIVGPKGTPYDGGLFEFDLFCPTNYPDAPPRMQFKTTGGGRAHFNPNLYADGKVCLSLLGTWSGQPWVASGPNKSTLLQLFISIQSMILCDEPWYNEPGRENQPNPAASLDYNVHIQSLTLPHALTNWLDPQNPNPIWKPVIDKHFLVNGEIILESVTVWATKAEARRTKNGARNDRPPGMPHFDDYYPGAHGRSEEKIPGLALAFEKALYKATGPGNVSSGGEGKRKFPYHD